MTSFTEENYIKAIYKLIEKNGMDVNTNAIAEQLETKAASVSDMLKKLAAKQLVNYQKYKGVTLTDKGTKIALNIIRKHRLWEMFLVEKLDFKWDEVHDIAEQLEHIHSEKLVEQIDKFLGYPKTDPHGDPIPDAQGKITATKAIALSQSPLHKTLIMTGVVDHSPAFLQYLDKLGISLCGEITIELKNAFDLSVEINLNNTTSFLISNEVAKNLLVLEK
jgi:DtxR family transcriptional regulator, Mn-dependent transcriptional regulator